ncbi:hypothetical protein JMJ77_0008181 [Colletotrichum scovillei]|uniref:Uncharacterized protein n=1 Tax=Colletotrichum scovillei TaxID=1209932 RepID=A0A9P7RHM9_9PEZI|nr:hypothetical protein JMJ77_0008181 [Colletotrichum scovillei]KAG7075173.1 hypothetical protein JMJ76_0011635 [Colletotrichum scovillei]KAG7082145.1 hypothetical protein JMJ78_0004250 [Colletotrichum scovillei]
MDDGDFIACSSIGATTLSLRPKVRGLSVGAPSYPACHRSRPSLRNPPLKSVPLPVWRLASTGVSSVSFSLLPRRRTGPASLSVRPASSVAQTGRVQQLAIWDRKRSATNRTLQVMSDRDGTWAPAVKSIAHGGPGYGEGEYRWWGGWGKKIEPKRWKQQCTSPCSLRCRGYSFSPPSDDIFHDPRGSSRNFDEDADDNLHAAPRLEGSEYGAKDDDG